MRKLSSTIAAFSSSNCAAKLARTVQKRTLRTKVEQPQLRLELLKKKRKHLQIAKIIKQVIARDAHKHAGAQLSKLSARRLATPANIVVNAWIATELAILQIAAVTWQSSARKLAANARIIKIITLFKISRCIGGC